MASNRSNYPRSELIEETIVNYLPWQWAILFVAVLAPACLLIWTPTFHNNRSLFVELQRVLEIGPAIAVVILPFIFSGGSLGRVLRDRLREPATFAQIMLAISGTVLLAAPSIYAVATGNETLRSWPGIHNNPNLVVAILHGVYILTLLIRNLFILLILCIPNVKERLSTYATYAAFQIAINLTGIYLLRMTFPTFGNTHGPTIHLGTFILFGVLADLSFFTIVWLLDRICFPSYRAILAKFIVSQVLFTALRFSTAKGLWYLGLTLLGVAIVAIYAVVAKPEMLSLKQSRQDQTLQS